jgi:hypothetical protein|nr:MAG TPA_asm: hypothetical protein [Caudoviricetes sp.]
MKLIGADALKEYCMNASKSDDDFRRVSLATLASVIDAQPTAYDVDKVVEQLREQQEKLETDIFARESDNWYGQYCNGIHEGIDKAIEIIKAGGIDGKDFCFKCENSYRYKTYWGGMETEKAVACLMCLVRVLREKKITK